MNKNPPRLRAFIFAGFALLALVLLSASLNSVEMSAGKPLAIPNIAPPVFDPSTATKGMDWLIAAIRVIIILCWIALPLYIILLFVSKDERRRFLRILATWTPVILLLYYLVNRKPNIGGRDLGGDLAGATSKSTLGAPAVPPPAFVPPAPWVTTFATIIIALIIAFILLGGFYLLWRQARHRQELREPIKRVEKEAQFALDAIASGGDLREVVIRCYIQMIDALKAYRGIHRNQDITPHEFELILSKQGVPGEPVHQLTQLFEEVRYGTFRPGRKDEDVAISSLSAIVSACQKAGGRRG